MATTRYVIAATEHSPEKTVSNLKSARVEADARAKLARQDVTVTTAATGKLAYTAKGAPTAPVAEPAAPAVEAEPDTAQGGADAAPGADGPDTAEEALPPLTVDLDGLIAEIHAEAQAQAEETQAEEAQEGTPAEAAPPAKDPERRARCGCLVEEMLSTGNHGTGCADAPARAARAQSVRRDPAPPKPSTGRRGGGRRESQGPSVLPDEWDLWYDHPGKHAQVGHRDGQYALICTRHMTAVRLKRLVDERQMRRDGGWCGDCG